MDKQNEESCLRRMGRGLGLAVQKSRTRNPNDPNNGGYCIVTDGTKHANGNVLVAGCYRGAEYSMTLVEVRQFLERQT